jgi:hypothetical protein
MEFPTAGAGLVGQPKDLTAPILELLRGHQQPVAAGCRVHTAQATIGATEGRYGPRSHTVTGFQLCGSRSTTIMYELDPQCALPSALFPEEGGCRAQEVCLACDVRGERRRYALANRERFHRLESSGRQFAEPFPLQAPTVVKSEQLVMARARLRQ